MFINHKNSHLSEKSCLLCQRLEYRLFHFLTVDFHVNFDSHSKEKKRFHRRQMNLELIFDKTTAFPVNQ